MGRRTILEQKGFSEAEIQKELAVLEAKISKWRNQRHALPPELMNMMTEEERMQVGEIGDMTYGELQALVTQLSERMQVNEWVAKEGSNSTDTTARSRVSTDEEETNRWKIDEREMAKRHGAKESEIPEKSLHDLHVEGELAGEGEHPGYAKRTYSNVGKPKDRVRKQPRAPVNANAEYESMKRFASLNKHMLHPKNEEEAKRRMMNLQVPTQECASQPKDPHTEAACAAYANEDIETARQQGVNVAMQNISEKDIKRYELEMLNEVQEFDKKKREEKIWHSEL